MTRPSLLVALCALVFILVSCATQQNPDPQTLSRISALETQVSTLQTENQELSTKLNAVLEHGAKLQTELALSQTSEKQAKTAYDELKKRADHLQSVLDDLALLRLGGRSETYSQPAVSASSVPSATPVPAFIVSPAPTITTSSVPFVPAPKNKDTLSTKVDVSERSSLLPPPATNWGKPEQVAGTRLIRQRIPSGFVLWHQNLPTARIGLSSLITVQGLDRSFVIQIRSIPGKPLAGTHRALSLVDPSGPVFTVASSSYRTEPGTEGTNEVWTYSLSGPERAELLSGLRAGTWNFSVDDPLAPTLSLSRDDIAGLAEMLEAWSYLE